MKKRNDRGPYVPDDELLMRGAPLAIWKKARGECERSPMLRFRAGAVLFNHRGIISSGCSNPDVERCKSVRSIHAEHHALRNAYNEDVEGAWIAVFTINESGGCAWSSRPCYRCASLLFKRGIARIIYPERRKDNSWFLRGEFPEELLSRKIIISGPFAKHMRVPDAD
jgi:deoxycytidylate deaminase